MAGGSSDLLVVRTILFIVAATLLVYIIGRRILRKQRRPIEETVETTTVEDETETSTPAMELGSFKHEVFISFRGTDTRNGFTSHLHKELKTHDITTFIDSEDLEKGEKISVLLERIEGSKIFLPVFSTNYAGSKWCLREISKIVEINKREGKRRPIIPIFYHVDPSDVRHCNGLFGKAFEELQKDKELGEEEINEWKTALKAAGEHSGYPLSKTEGNEAELITCIRKRVSDILCKVRFHIQPVGILPSIHTLKQMLEREKDGVCMIGICGMGGIGKTTLAMALYNELSPKFEGSCFLSNIRSKSENRDGLPTLQAELLNEVVGRRKENITTVEGGVNLIKQLLGARKVLLILDDVDDKKQLKAFAADCREKEKWFGKGSKIIVTARDGTALLQHGLQVCDIYFLEKLNRRDSLQLFCHHAFVSDQPLVGFEELSLEVVKVAKGLPLALEVFGSLFGPLEDKKEWDEMLETLKRNKHNKAREILKIIYDSLDPNQQCVFLDIACFFIGWEKDSPVYMWEAYGYSPRITLKALQNKSLIKIDKNGCFEMHDEIRDMGRMIVEEEGNSDPLKYSRPWSEDQLLEVLRDAKVSHGNPYIQGIDFNRVGYANIMMSWRDIKDMPSLRMIIGIYGSLLVGEETIHLPSNTRWLEWRECPHQMLTFHNHEKLCVLYLTSGEFRDFGSRSMKFPNLKVLDLSWCKHLKRTPDFTHFSSLQKLVLDGCWSLTNIDESIGHLKELVELSMVGCWRISVLPDSITFPNLKVLDLSGCLCLKCTPYCTHFPSLQKLVLDGCSSTMIESIGHLKELVELSMVSCSSISVLPDSIGSLQSLEKLDLTCCSKLEKVPDSICGLKNLSSLSLQNCEKLKQLPNSMGMLTSLKRLKIDYCKSLREVPDSLGDLNNDLQISLEGCTLLEKLPKSIRVTANHSEEKPGALMVGMIPHALKQMLEKEKHGICMIGICALDGIKKTKLAMALYNELSPTFQYRCFLSGIRSKCQNSDVLPTLQAEFINEVLMGRETKKIANVEQGVNLIKESLQDKQVLLILDDVGHKNQLAAFTAHRRKKEQWFGKGSKIIVTTMDMTVLLQHGLQESDIYYPEGPMITILTPCICQ